MLPAWHVGFCRRQEDVDGPEERSQLSSGRHAQVHAEAGRWLRWGSHSVQAGRKLGGAQFEPKGGLPPALGGGRLCCPETFPDGAGPTHTKWVSGSAHSPLAHMLAPPGKHLLSHVSTVLFNAMLACITHRDRNGPAVGGVLGWQPTGQLGSGTSQWATMSTSLASPDLPHLPGVVRRRVYISIVPASNSANAYQLLVGSPGLSEL